MLVENGLGERKRKGKEGKSAGIDDEISWSRHEDPYISSGLLSFLPLFLTLISSNRSISFLLSPIPSRLLSGPSSCRSSLPVSLSLSSRRE